MFHHSVDSYTGVGRILKQIYNCGLDFYLHISVVFPDARVNPFAQLNKGVLQVINSR